MGRTQGKKRLLRCERCGRTVESSPAELLKYSAGRWPKCCGEVMTLVVETDKPDSKVPKRPPKDKSD